MDEEPNRGTAVLCGDLTSAAWAWRAKDVLRSIGHAWKLVLSRTIQRGRGSIMLPASSQVPIREGRVTGLKANDATVSILPMVLANARCVISAYEAISVVEVRLGRNQNRPGCVSASGYLDGGPLGGALRWEWRFHA